MTAVGPVLVARGFAATSRATCSPSSLDIAIAYAPAPDGRSAVQTRIEAGLAMPELARVGRWGGLELLAADGVRVSRIGLYRDFAKVSQAAVPPGPPDAPAVWLGLGGLDGDGGPETDAVLDRAGGRVLLHLSPTARWLMLADRLWIGLDRSGGLSALLAGGVRWVTDDPV